MIIETDWKGKIEVHQLLCGREIAKDRRANQLHSFAAQMQNYVYLIVDLESKTATAVDPAWDCVGLAGFSKELGYVITECVFTHNHADHTGGTMPRQFVGNMKIRVEGLADMLSMGCRVGIGEEDADFASFQTGVETSKMKLLHDGDTVPIGNSKVFYLRVLHTPGHTQGSSCFRIETASPKRVPKEDESTAAPTPSSLIFTGDTLFIGSCGRTDLPESDVYAMLESLQRLSTLPKDDVVLPGHNYAMENLSTIGIEKETNFVMREAIGRKSSPGKGVTNNPVACMVQLPDYLEAAEASLVEAASGRLALPSRNARTYQAKV